MTEIVDARQFVRANMVRPVILVMDGERVGKDDQIQWEKEKTGAQVLQINANKGTSVLPPLVQGTGKNPLSLNEKVNLRKCVKTQINRTKYSYSKATQEKVAISLLKIKMGQETVTMDEGAPPVPKKQKKSDSNPDSAGGDAKRKTLPKAARNKLKNWLFNHLAHPYPTEEEKLVLQKETSLSVGQISNWFINARRRILQPMLEQAKQIAKKRSKEGGQANVT
eukprot:Nk52_evm35s279 gene=Nk52_evmTU35s279